MFVKELNPSHQPFNPNQQQLVRNMNEDNSILDRKHKRVQIELVVDPKFFAILPAININLHSKTLEFEWLFFAMYVDRLPNLNMYRNDSDIV